MRVEKRAELDRIKFELSAKSRIQIPNRSDDKMFMQITTHKYVLNDGHVQILERLEKGRNYNTDGGDAVAVLPITNNGDIVFAIQHRDIGVCIELPAGYVDKGEGLIQASRRELKEEAGLLCNISQINKVDEYPESTGNGLSMIHVFIASPCIDTFKQHLEKSEHIKLFRCTIEEGIEMFENRELTGASAKLAFAMGKHLIKHVKEG